MTEDALLPVGTSLGVRHFVPGQYVDVTGITRGKGFQVNSLGLKLHPIVSLSFLSVAYSFSFLIPSWR